MPDAVVSLVRAGNLIAAIKEYRSITGAGLAEAKQAVEAMR
jgi:ribosomal protein L7/L12